MTTITTPDPVYDDSAREDIATAAYALGETITDIRHHHIADTAIELWADDPVAQLGELRALATRLLTVAVDVLNACTAIDDDARNRAVLQAMTVEGLARRWQHADPRPGYDTTARPASHNERNFTLVEAEIVRRGLDFDELGVVVAAADLVAARHEVLALGCLVRSGEELVDRESVGQVDAAGFEVIVEPVSRGEDAGLGERVERAAAVVVRDGPGGPHVHEGTHGCKRASQCSRHTNGRSSRGERDRLTNARSPREVDEVDRDRDMAYLEAHLEQIRRSIACTSGHSDMLLELLDIACRLAKEREVLRLQLWEIQRSWGTLRAQMTELHQTLR